MKLVLDTHIWLWWVNQTNDLSDLHRTVIEEATDVYISAISCWEVALLEQRQRIQLPIDRKRWFQLALEQSGIVCLPLNQMIAIQAAIFPCEHKDPADRFIIATALEHQFHLMSFDETFPQFESLQPYLLGRQLNIKQ